MCPRQAAWHRVPPTTAAEPFRTGLLLMQMCLLDMRQQHGTACGGNELCFTDVQHDLNAASLQVHQCTFDSCASYDVLFTSSTLRSPSMQWRLKLASSGEGGEPANRKERQMATSGGCGGRDLQRVSVWQGAMELLTADADVERHILRAAAGGGAAQVLLRWFRRPILNGFVRPLERCWKVGPFRREGTRVPMWHGPGTTLRCAGLGSRKSGPSAVVMLRCERTNRTTSPCMLHRCQVPACGRGR